ncbi:4-hydroxyphenylacetate 3-hydroxylase family protein [Streptomyces sp. NPDC058280]|uniref:4-hydroxyphenylacetate 3-hydroxylase family protein n=1 Tax=Streptomyces sp. NPDC058280 TaxID=3346419 RepID=UPI0036E6A42C
MRTGAEYLAALRDGREVYVDGARVEDVTAHPAFSPIARTVAELYDVAADPKSRMSCVDEATGEETNRVFTAPRTPRELAAYRRAVQLWARHSHGWVGRSPDHVGAFLTAFATHPEEFNSGGRELGENVTAYHRKVQREQLYVSYAIIPPQMSRATTAHAWGDDLVQVGVAAAGLNGLVVSGAQMLATGAAVADEILVSCIKPLGPEDRDFALSFVLPIATDGLKFHCRRPYAPAATSGYDYPLTSRYDETDALVVFDDVFVPWSRVFVDRDVDGLKRQFFDTGAHVFGNWQAQIRLAVKLQFLAGIARKVAAVNGIDRIPGVVEKLGELAAIASVVESGVIAAEHTATPDDAGIWRPGARALYGAMGLQSELYPRAVSILRELVGGGVLQVPSSVEDMRSSTTRPDIDRYVRSPGVDAEDRVKLFKLAWDSFGSEFGGRHQQYEMFYAGAPFVAKGYAFRHYGYEEAVDEVDRFLASYGSDE